MNNDNTRLQTDAEKKLLRNNLLTSVFLMITSALGPGFLTQTANFTEQLGANFAFAIMLSIVISFAAQLNIWRVLSVSGMYAQDLSNKILPGLGYAVSFFIVLGGLAFNIGNVGGAGLGLNAVFGIDYTVGAVITGIIAIVIFISKSGKSLVDRFIQLLGIVMLILALYVAIATKPPVGEALQRMIMPENIESLILPIITLVGGTVGGYISFSGGHRLIDSGITGMNNVKNASNSATFAIVGSGIMRLLLFFVFLGVVSTGAGLDPSNPAASAFEIALGRPGEIIFGIILFSAGISSVIGAAYTSASFLKTFHPILEKYNNLVIVAFIVFSTIVYAFVGQPVMLLIIAGSLNGLILPLTLGTILIGANRKDIVGPDYKHPVWLTVLGVVAALATLYLGIQSLSGIAALWQG